MTRTMSFTATAQARPRGGIAVALPFDPADAWGERDRYYLAGTETVDLLEAGHRERPGR